MTSSSFWICVISLFAYVSTKYFMNLFRTVRLCTWSWIHFQYCLFYRLPRSVDVSWCCCVKSALLTSNKTVTHSSSSRSDHAKVARGTEICCYTGTQELNDIRKGGRMIQGFNYESCRFKSFKRCIHKLQCSCLCGWVGSSRNLYSPRLVVTQEYLGDIQRVPLAFTTYLRVLQTKF